MNPEKIYPHFLEKLETQTKSQILSILHKKGKIPKEEKYRVIISFDDISKRKNFISKNKNFEILSKFNLIPSISLNLTRKEIKTLQQNDLIKRIEEDQKLYLSLLDVIEKIGLNQYRKSKNSYTGKETTIGIIDDGINQKFETFKGVDIYYYALNEKDKKTKITHGTLIANIIVNQYLDETNNSIGIAPDTKLFDFDISNSKEQYFFSDVLNIFDYILKNNLKISILLISFTTLNPSDGNDILSLSCNLLVDKGFILVCPAGNFGPESYTIGSPSAAEKAITIGSHTKDMKISYFSGRGPTLDERMKPDFCLPGSKIEIPLSDAKRVNLSGTSVSAAICAGIIALIKESDPKMTYLKIYDIIKRASINLNYREISQGSGTISIPKICEQIEAKKVKSTRVKLKDDVFYGKKAIKTNEDKKLLSYNQMMLKSLGVAIQFIIIFILIFYAFYYIDFIVNLFSNIFRGWR
ncbi:MAG: S8 family serine peptidase [Promethearchaeota archaeon]